MSAFTHDYRIRFSDCDPAGIVFYPQYFVMFNGVLQQWVDAGGIGFHALIMQRRIGMPTVHLACDFTAPSRMGDDVRLSLQAERIGRRSLTLALSCHGADGACCLSVRQVIVTTSLDTHQAIELPGDLRNLALRTMAPGSAASATAIEP